MDEAETGLGESNAFILDTGGDDGTPKSGHGNSAGFTLDTRAGGDTGSTIDPEETGASDSGAFILDTSDGNATQPDITSGFADSGGFTLDTYDPSPFQDTGFEIPEDLFSIPEVMMERSRVVSLTRVVSFSIRGIPLWKIAINLNPASMIPVASSWTLKMMITNQL